MILLSLFPLLDKRDAVSDNSLAFCFSQLVEISYRYNNSFLKRGPADSEAETSIDILHLKFILIILTEVE